MTPVLATSDLAVGYSGRPVVEHIDLTLLPGQALSLVGVNGSGKSTLLKTIAGLLEPISGEMKVFGDVPGAAPNRVAYLGQFHAAAEGLLPMQVRDVVLMARYRRRGLLGRLTRADHAVVEASLERLEIGRLATKPLRALSGGQQRRVHLAHVLASEADLLLLDEPTAGLDAGANERYAQLIREELDRGASVAVATHDVRDAARADCVVLLAGRVIAAGAPRDVLTQEQLAHAFGIALLAIPHGDHTDLIVPEDAHAHDEHGMHDRHGHA